MSHVASSSATATARLPSSHGPRTGPGRDVPAPQRRARVAPALDEGEVAELHALTADRQPRPAQLDRQARAGTGSSSDRSACATDAPT